MDISSLWKVYRELDRARQALHSLLASIYEPFIQYCHDSRRHLILRWHDGVIPLGPKIALFLIYQPKGVGATCLATCQHLVFKGYAPLVVSNSNLSLSDIGLLQKVAWKVIVRPNYGYDFGGYRDGILWLREAGILPSRLMILNDSIWFPVWPGESLIDRMEALPVDLVGAVMHPAQRRNKMARRRPAFMESYFYMVNGGCLGSSAFWSFWSSFRVSSIKFNAVYRGERSFSSFLEKSGLSVKGIISKPSILAALKDVGDEFLAKTLEYGAYVDPEYYSESRRLLALAPSVPGWRESVLAHIETVVYRRSSYASFPFAAYHLIAIPFVKKSRLFFWGKKYGTIQIKMRTQLLRAVRSGDIPSPLPEVLAEMEALEDSFV